MFFYLQITVFNIYARYHHPGVPDTRRGGTVVILPPNSRPRDATASPNGRGPAIPTSSHSASRVVGTAYRSDQRDQNVRGSSYPRYGGVAAESGRWQSYSEKGKHIRFSLAKKRLIFQINYSRK